AKDGAKIMFLCSPNNPTGAILSEGEVRAYCGIAALVVLDEAYVEFSNEGSLVRMVEKFPNLIVLRTMSKAWGAAGIRLGYAVGDARIIEEMNKVKAPYNVNQLTQEKALEILDQEEQMRKRVAIIVAERLRLSVVLRRFGFSVWYSQANFLLFEAPEGTFQKLLDRGVLVRDLSSKIANALRVTIGTKEQNDQFLNILSSGKLHL
ncbi:aminotransferase class I/II-fold pyridoxal phosphate-dependent enzyme, partial [Candidatus Gracilibacteria bacterium]|nr:aminotransferase class I/II-fold pyridoxal phosphate-dependent enzyme [Candidatus Gracilibacteria bacterium]